ncbi:MAG: hypothetical protein IT428_25320 [Planctomycetaceae bacterium]|nr:hypothetical protein [Planctomycetaceae bacterium]
MWNEVEYLIQPGTMARLPALLVAAGWKVDHSVDPSYLDCDRGGFLASKDGFELQIFVLNPLLNSVRPQRENPDLLPIMAVNAFWKNRDSVETAGNRRIIFGELSEFMFQQGAWVSRNLMEELSIDSDS